jgi:hypothetical protein
MIRKVFEQKGDFKAMWAAEQWCKENGITVGLSCGPDPRGLMYGTGFLIMKWSNLSNSDEKKLHGRMTGDMRNGPVTIEIREKAAADEQAEREHQERKTAAETKKRQEAAAPDLFAAAQMAYDAWVMPAQEFEKKYPANSSHEAVETALYMALQKAKGEPA